MGSEVGVVAGAEKVGGGGFKSFWRAVSRLGGGVGTEGPERGFGDDMVEEGPDASPSCMLATSSATIKTFFFNTSTMSLASVDWPIEQASLPVLAVCAILRDVDGRGE